jgi:Fe-S-cluster containining protein
MWKTPRGAPQELALLPLVKQSEHPCHGCAKCCLYVAIEIDSPTSMTEYDHVLWYLYHENVSVFVDWEGQWFVKFDTRCKNLTQSGLCGIYERRPAICKDFDWRECENHMTPEEGPPDKWLWETPDAFVAWFEKQRPKASARYRAYMKKKHASAEEPELGRVAAASR